MRPEKPPHYPSIPAQRPGPGALSPPDLAKFQNQRRNGPKTALSGPGLVRAQTLTSGHPENKACRSSQGTTGQSSHAPVPNSKLATATSSLTSPRHHLHASACRSRHPSACSPESRPSACTRLPRIRHFGLPLPAPNPALRLAPACPESLSFAFPRLEPSFQESRHPTSPPAPSHRLRMPHRLPADTLQPDRRAFKSPPPSPTRSASSRPHGPKPIFDAIFRLSVQSECEFLKIMLGSPCPFPESSRLGILPPGPFRETEPAA